VRLLQSNCVIFANYAVEAKTQGFSCGTMIFASLLQMKSDQVWASCTPQFCFSTAEGKEHVLGTQILQGISSWRCVYKSSDRTLRRDAGVQGCLADQENRQKRSCESMPVRGST
jgi:hypothetical protein